MNLQVIIYLIFNMDLFLQHNNALRKDLLRSLRERDASQFTRCSGFQREMIS